MYKMARVKIDTDMVERYLEVNKMAFRQLSESLGHTRTYWYGIKANGGYMLPNAAKLLCNVLGLNYDKLVIPDRTASNAKPQNEQKSVLEEDESLLKALVECMQRIEAKANEAAIDMNRLEIQMRTVLKELGVK